MQQRVDSAAEHVAGKAAVNPVTATELMAPEPTSAVGRWAAARTVAGAAAVAAPKPVVQFSMADDASRREVRGEIEPAMWRALGVEREGRREAMVGELVEALGESAREQTKKHVNAMMAFQFTKMSEPKELVKLRAVDGPMGGKLSARPLSEEGALALGAEVMRAGFPEFDWTPMAVMAHRLGRLLELPGNDARRRAGKIYWWGMRELQAAGRAARDDTSPGGLHWLDVGVFTRELKRQVNEAIEGYDKHRGELEDFEARLGEATPRAAGAPAGAGAGQGGAAAAAAATAAAAAAASPAGKPGGLLGRALGVPDMGTERVREVRASFVARFPGKCMYQALVGSCRPRQGDTCQLSHDVPAQPEMQEWAQGLGYHLQ